MPRLRTSRATTFLAVILLLAATLLYFSPHRDPSMYDVAAPDYVSSTHRGHSDPLDRLHAKHNPAGWMSFFSSEDPSTLPGLEYGEDGLVKGWDKVHELVKKGDGISKSAKKRLKMVRDKHPIEELIEMGKSRWESLLARQSKTLPQAVTEYTRRYGRAPPRGFEEWWQFCKRHNVKIVDDYDQIDRDIGPYFAISPELFRKRADELFKTAFTYEIVLSPSSGTAQLTGERTNSARAKLLRQLLEPVASLLPKEVVMHCSDHDLGSWLLGDDQKQACMKAIEEGRYLSEEELKPYEKREGRVKAKGLASACPEGSPAWNQSLEIQAGHESQLEDKGTAFVWDPLATYDFCYNPNLLRQHGTYSFDFVRETILRPIFQLSKNIRNPEFLTTPLEAYENATSATAQSKTAPWETKTVDKLFWRGSSTGDSYAKKKKYSWKESHRPRLHLMIQETQGETGVWVQRGREWEWEMWGTGKLNERYMDIGLAGKPHQCRQDDGTCDEMTAALIFKDRVRPEDAIKYKYVFDIDGNGWSSRFHRLMLSGSVVVKATIFPEWHSDWITPWVHYIPCQIDYSDLYSIMSFFTGSPDSRTQGRDDLAREISEQGQKFTQEHWRWEDMQAYMFRLLLEYARLEADDREAWSYQKTYT